MLILEILTAFTEIKFDFKFYFQYVITFLVQEYFTKCICIFKFFPLPFQLALSKLFVAHLKSVLPDTHTSPQQRCCLLDLRVNNILLRAPYSPSPSYGSYCYFLFSLHFRRSQPQMLTVNILVRINNCFLLILIKMLHTT